MATPTLQATNTGSESIIAGYFKSGEDAHRAIHALLDEGFSVSQIGAAFHSSGSQALEQDGSAASDATDAEFDATVTKSIAGTDTSESQGGPTSDTTAVQPIGLAPGSGTPFYGAGKPGPIPGSSFAHTGLPSELTSELAHDEPGTSLSEPVQASPDMAFSAPRPVAKIGRSSWTDKLKHLFSSQATEPVTAAPAATAQDQNFGTGEGHLSLSRPYSAAAFANSVSSAGASPEHSHSLSRRLSSGGAVVTVSDTGRAIEIEKIFERHNGAVRFASDIFDDAATSDYDARVEVFGHLQHRYPVL